MTSIGIEEIKKIIKEHPIYVPNLCKDQLDAWFDGFRNCFDMVMDILDDYKEERNLQK